MSQPTEKQSGLSLQEFDSAALLNADLNTMSTEELTAMVKRFQQNRVNPHEIARQKKTAAKKATGTHVDPLAGLI
jgi:hypothetical protein